MKVDASLRTFGRLTMKCMQQILFSFALVGLLVSPALAQDKKPDDKKAEPKTTEKKAEPKATENKDDGKLPHTKLPPGKLMPNLCVVKYRVSTASPECQAYFDQGLAFYYSYVWLESARSFEMAAKADPNCALAWWGLSKACEKWGRVAYAPPLKKAQELMSQANEREQRLIKARLQEKGLIEGIKVEDRRKEAGKTLDELLALYDDDEEGWFARSQVADGPNAHVPFHKALLRINPQHPGAHHELLHHYENIRRPVLGWQHAEGYVASSPGIPHAFHMQAHLAMRIGKWDKTTDRSSKAIELEEAYHKLLNVPPNDDWQFSHHLETLMQSLIHDGRFKEAHVIRKKCENYKYVQRNHWFRLALAERDWDEALKQANSNTKDKIMTSYMRALVYLNKGDYERALPEVNVLQEAYQMNRANKDLELRLWTAQGLLLCATGGGDGGVKLLAKTVEKTKDDYGKHAWGHGAYYMEYWGLGALRANRLDVAEEAFLEALAHDAGSVRGALGMYVVCERQGRTEEMNRFAELAQRCWRKADPSLIQAELEYLRSQGSVTSASSPTKGTN
jgi:tetratricopeptide (TPR) repeat protein